MRVPSIGALLVVAAALVACSNDPEGNEPVELPGTPVALAYVTPSGQPTGVEEATGYTDPVRLVVRDEAAWSDAWAYLVGSAWIDPVPPAPSIDFSTEMVVVAGIGYSGGRVSMRMPLAALQADGSLSVAVVKTTAGSGCAWGPMVTWQASAARVPRADTVKFVEFDQVRDCE